MSKNILIVDNSLVIRRVIKKLLGQTDLSDSATFEAQNGFEALEVLDKEEIQVVFLDLNMPLMDGFEFLRRFGERDDKDKTEVVVCSTEGSEEREKELKELGVKHKLLKPIKPESFVETVNNIFKG